jgi:hypothetical protein
MPYSLKFIACKGSHIFGDVKKAKQKNAGVAPTFFLFGSSAPAFA